MADLDEIRRQVVEDFLQNAKQLCQRILMEKSLRSPPFTDTMLRDFAIQLPNTINEMKRISGIDEAKVQLYGARFLPLIKNAQKLYEDLQEKELEKVQDPNHENVIDLVSDDEGKNKENEEYSESDFDWPMADDENLENEDPQFELDDESMDDEEPQQRSQYFEKPPPEIQAFNSQFAVSKERREQDVGKRAKATPSSVSKASGKGSGTYGRQKRGSNRGGYAKTSRSGFKKGRGGSNWPKRKSSGTRQTSRGGGTGSSRSMSVGTDRGGRGGGGIAMMPV